MKHHSQRGYKSCWGGEIWNFNLLILDRVEILPKYRGGGIGLLVLTSLIERFSAGAGVVGMKFSYSSSLSSPVILRRGRNVLNSKTYHVTQNGDGKT